jgi:hypothetical protein
MECWSNDIEENWSIGVVEYWNGGTAKSGITHYSITPSLHFCITTLLVNTGDV